MSIKQVSFFIIGAPKCGTSALAHYLAEHPNVVFSDPKESYFFSPELNLTGRKVEATLHDYHKLYKSDSETKVFGEGSVGYFLSENAVSNILKYNPDARFIVMLREPASMLYSWHNQLLLNLLEWEPSFKKSWEEQSKREAGKILCTATNVTPEIFKWRQWVSYGTLLERLYHVVPNNQCKVIIFDDFIKDTSIIYKDVLNFIGIPDDGRDEFSVVNKSKKNRQGFVWLIKLNKKIPQGIKNKIKSFLRSAFFINIDGNFLKFLKPEVSLPNIDSALQKEINESLRSEIEKAGEILDRDLVSIWLPTQS